MGRVHRKILSSCINWTCASSAPAKCKTRGRRRTALIPHAGFGPAAHA
ncbi:hypothetical protein RGUI_1727 [Rhodovulum sp. P5]|nr:hypothetical protein RGUI_1727 [Rhodovulum sp. P5]